MAENVRVALFRRSDRSSIMFQWLRAQLFLPYFLFIFLFVSAFAFLVFLVGFFLFHRLTPLSV
jgi:hypothetical protein